VISKGLETVFSSPLIIDQDKKLGAEAKDKQEIDKSGNFLYLVRGMPWERHIQNIKIRKAEQDLDPEGSVGQFFS
jgi:hypothetical protein